MGVRWMTCYAPTSSSFTTRLPDINKTLTINDDTTTTTTTATTTTIWGLSSIFESVVSDLRDGILWAVPKSRRSLAKRRWRRKHQALKPRNEIEECVVCGAKKLQGHLCTECFRGNSWVVGKLGDVAKKEKMSTKDEHTSLTEDVEN